MQGKPLNAPFQNQKQRLRDGLKRAMGCKGIKTAPRFLARAAGQMTAPFTEPGKRARLEKEGHIMSPEVISIYITTSCEFCLRKQQEIMKIHPNKPKVQIQNEK